MLAGEFSSPALLKISWPVVSPLGLDDRGVPDRDGGDKAEA
jgi:hypothetical protein